MVLSTLLFSASILESSCLSVSTIQWELQCYAYEQHEPAFESTVLVSLLSSNFLLSLYMGS